MKLDPQQGPVWTEVDLHAIAHNLRAIRRHIGAQPKILAVVKADAYGHGAPQVARALARAGADCFGVTCTREGAELRASGIRRPILVLTGFWPGEERHQLECKLTPSITDVAHLPLLDRTAGKMLRRKGTWSAKSQVSFHLKIDTGMNRLGIPPQDLPRFAAALADCRYLALAGVFTHFAAAEDFSSPQSEEQIRLFDGCLAQLRAAGIDPGIVHMANSAAIAARPATWRDMVRPGALLYGYHQFYEPPERRAAMQKKLPLHPALALRARIVSMKEVAAGTPVGYNGKFVTTRASRIGVLAAGYAEGLVRLLTNRGRVVVRGRCAPLVGVISMDMAMVDLTALPAAGVGDVATIFGADRANGCSLYADDLARELGTVTSDLLCAVGRRVPRIFV
jgi:alanine racemase